MSAVTANKHSLANFQNEHSKLKETKLSSMGFSGDYETVLIFFTMFLNTGFVNWAIYGSICGPSGSTNDILA